MLATSAATETVIVKTNLFQDLMYDLMEPVREYVKVARIRLDLQNQKKQNGLLWTFATSPIQSYYYGADDPNMTETKFNSADDYEKEFMILLNKTNTAFEASDLKANINELSESTQQRIDKIQENLTADEIIAGKYDCWLSVNRNTLQWMLDPARLAILVTTLKYQRKRFALDKAEEAMAKLEAEQNDAEQKRIKAAAAAAALQKLTSTPNDSNTPVEAIAQEEVIEKPKILSEREAKQLRTSTYIRLLSDLLAFLFRTAFELHVDAAKTIQPKLAYTRTVPNALATSIIELITAKILDISAAHTKFEDSMQVFTNVCAHTSKLLRETEKKHAEVMGMFSSNAFTTKFIKTLQEFDEAIEKLDPNYKPPTRNKNSVSWFSM